VSRPIQNGELVDSARRCGRKYRIDHRRLVGNGDVDVETEDEERSRKLLELFDDAVVADTGREDLVLPV
jgi:hypothetical protein